MKTILILLVSSMCVLAAPRRPLQTYDQRQDGKLNVHGKFDNFLFVLGIPEGLSFRSAGSPIAADIAKTSEFETSIDARVAHPEESQSSDGHREAEISSIPEAEAVATKKIEDDKSSDKIVDIVKEDHPIESAESASPLPPLGSDPKLQDKKTEDLKENVAKSEVHTKSARSLKNRSSEILSVSKLPPKDSGLAPLENKVAGNAGKNRGNDVESFEAESKLIGGGIENCGPERFRNRAGICQFRVAA